MPHRQPRSRGALALAAVAVVGLTACQEDGPRPSTSSSPLPSPTSSSPPPSAEESGATGSTGPTPTPEESDVRIDVTVEGETFGVTLDGSPASRDLVAQLPLTLQVSDHGGVEKTGPLPAGLSLEGQPDGADPEVGDLGYYAPGNDLVLYYGNQSYFPGIVVIGRMDDGAAERISAMDDDVTVQVAPSP